MAKQTVRKVLSENQMLVIRRAGIDDIGFVKELESEAGLSAWAQQDYLLEVSREDSLFFIAQDGRELLGFILARLIMNPQNSLNSLSCENEIEIYNLAVSPKCRKNGVGSLLLNEVVRVGRERNVCKIYLEVRMSNDSAIDFYKKNHFNRVGKRKNFYSNPMEDAVLMARDISLLSSDIT